MDEDSEESNSARDQSLSLASIFNEFKIENFLEQPHANFFLFTPLYVALNSYCNKFIDDDDIAAVLSEFKDYYHSLNSFQKKQLFYYHQTYLLHNPMDVDSESAIYKLHEELGLYLAKDFALPEENTKEQVKKYIPLEKKAGFQHLNLKMLSSISNVNEASRTFFAKTSSGKEIEVITYRDIHFSVDSSDAESFIIRGELRIKYIRGTNKIDSIETSNSALLDLFSSLDTNRYGVMLGNIDESANSKDEIIQQYKEYFRKIARKASVEEFTKNEFDRFVSGLNKELQRFNPASFYLFSTDEDIDDTSLARYKRSYASYEEAYKAAKKIFKNLDKTFYIVEADQKNVPDNIQAKQLVGKNIDNVEGVYSCLSVKNKELPLDKSLIVYSKNSPVIAFQNAIHEISLKEKELVESILLKLFPQDTIINSKLIALQSLKKELEEKLNMIKNPNKQSENVSVQSVVESFEEKNNAKMRAINKRRHSFFSKDESSTRKLVERLKSDDRYTKKGNPA